MTGSDATGFNPEKARARIVYGSRNERKVDARWRGQLRAWDFSDTAVVAIAKTQRTRRKQRHRETWPIGRPQPVLIPWPQCTGTTKAGERCRRGAIVNRLTQQPYDGQRCRWHGGLEELQRQLQQTAAQLSAAAHALEERIGRTDG